MIEQPADPSGQTHPPDSPASGEAAEAPEVAEGSVPWRTAMQRALYGRHGFFMRERPADHFRTSVHTSPLFAEAVARLAVRLDRQLNHPARFSLLDVGAGRGELLTAVLGSVDEEFAARLRPHAVERASRPRGLDRRIGWSAELPRAGSLTGLVFANEWLDNVPVEVAEVDGAGVVRYVRVDRTGRERLGAEVTGPDARWLTRWWPLEGAEPGARAEIGGPRDTEWAAATNTLKRGLAVAVDYSHTRSDRPMLGSLTGYLDGREVPAVPDGRRDLTAHVALDACAAADGQAASGGARLLTQRAALHSLGVRGGRPPLSWASIDAAAYVRALSTASKAAELTDPHGLGGFGWLVCPVGLPKRYDPFE